MAGLLDALFNGGLPTQTNLAPDPQEAYLADLFRRMNAGAQRYEPPQVPQQAPPAQTGHVMPPSQAPAPREPNMWDRLGALSRGYDKGGLVGGIADAANLGQSRDELTAQDGRNDTFNWLLKNNVDEPTARAAIRSPEIMKALLTSKLGGGAEYGKTGAIMQGEDGKFYSVQFASNGQKIVEPLHVGGKGLTPARGVMQVGDELVDKAHGGTVRNMAPQIMGKERAEELGTAQAKAQVNLPQVEAAADRMLKQLDELATDPSLESVTGWVGGRIPQAYQTEDMARAQSRINQVAGGIFLQAYNELRGGGAITEQEGAQARAAYARLGTQTMGTEDYRRALQEARDETLKLVELAKRKAAGGGVSAPQTGPIKRPSGLVIERVE